MKILNITTHMDKLGYEESSYEFDTQEEIDKFLDIIEKYIKVCEELKNIKLMESFDKFDTIKDFGGRFISKEIKIY